MVGAPVTGSIGGLWSVMCCRSSCVKPGGNLPNLQAYVFRTSLHDRKNQVRYYHSILLSTKKVMVSLSTRLRLLMVRVMSRRSKFQEITKKSQALPGRLTVIGEYVCNKKSTGERGSRDITWSQRVLSTCLPARSHVRSSR